MPLRWLADGRLEHGYALTCHKAQGLTVEHALVYGTGALTRQSGYVAMSRGRRSNHLYATLDPAAAARLGQRGGALEDLTVLADLTRAMARDDRQQLALATAPPPSTRDHPRSRGDDGGMCR